MANGMAFTPEDVEIEIRVRQGQDVHVLGWSDIARIVCIDGEYGVTDARLGGPQGMPVRSVTWVDTSDLRVEIPMPLDEARALGEVLGSSKVEIVKTMPSSLTVARRKPLWTAPPDGEAG